MANKGDKYIIEIKDLGVQSGTYYLKNSVFGHVVIPDEMLQGFEKYDPEADYQRGLNDAWELTQKIFCFGADGGMSSRELRDTFGTAALGTIAALPIEKVMSILTEYEAKKNAEEIKVGDEVITTAFNKVIVLKHLHDGYYAALNAKFEKVMIHSSRIAKKTGKHFPQVEEMIKIMNDGD